MGSFGKRGSQLVSGPFLMDFTVDASNITTNPVRKTLGLGAANDRFRFKSADDIILMINTILMSVSSGGNLWDCLGAG